MTTIVCNADFCGKMLELCVNCYWKWQIGITHKLNGRYKQYCSINCLINDLTMLLDKPIPITGLLVLPNILLVHQKEIMNESTKIYVKQQLKRIKLFYQRYIK